MSSPKDSPDRMDDNEIRFIKNERNPDGSIREVVVQGSPRAIAQGINEAGIGVKADVQADGRVTLKREGTGSENPLAGVIDTIEAIIIALILALTFRAFVVEAFVIPTGSMAPTLLGAHFKAVCTKCGYGFDVEADLRDQLARDKEGRPHIVSTAGGDLTSNRTVPCDTDPIFCPNCGDRIIPEQLPQKLDPVVVATDARPGRMPGSKAYFAWANNGDRILVLKYIYSIMNPERWDVIVFKEPSTAKNNYIKRLIGLPGETVEIIEGDIYIAEPGKTGAKDRKIARKPAHIQRALWQLVYDNDYVPVDEGMARDDGPIWRNPWEGEGETKGAWTFNGSKMVYDGKGSGTTQFVIRNEQSFYTYNTLGYNRDLIETSSKQFIGGRTRVGDLHMECVWTPADASGESVTMVLGQPWNCYKVTWNSKGLELSHKNATAAGFEVVKTIAAVESPKAGTPYRLEFNNVDHAAQFLVDGKLMIEHQPVWTVLDAEAERNAVAASNMVRKPDVYITVGGVCTLGHVKIMRDLYYTRPDGNATAIDGNPLTLNPDEYFALGDNSRKSSDGRIWDRVYPALDDLGTPRGVVPERYLLGKAFFVYWPAGFRLTPYRNADLPIVPDAGDMRLIR